MVSLDGLSGAGAHRVWDILRVICPPITSEGITMAALLPPQPVDPESVGLRWTACTSITGAGPGPGSYGQEPHLGHRSPRPRRLEFALLRGQASGGCPCWASVAAPRCFNVALGGTLHFLQHSSDILGHSGIGRATGFRLPVHTASGNWLTELDMATTTEAIDQVGEGLWSVRWLSTVIEALVTWGH